jgi:hypothetical protein
VNKGTAVVAHLSPGEWSACFGASLIDLLFYDLAHNRRVVGHQYGHLHKEAGADNVYAARNKCCQVLLDDTHAEWLLFIDSDMGFAADTLDELIRSADPVSRPVVGGLAFAMRSDGAGEMFARRYRAVPTIYHMADTGDEVGFVPMFDYPKDSVVEVDATGAAILLIHRSALEAVRDKCGDTWFDHVAKPKGDGKFGEDLSFCIRLKSCDIPMHVNTAVKTTHDKGGVFLDEYSYGLQRAMQELFHA